MSEAEKPARCCVAIEVPEELRRGLMSNGRMGFVRNYVRCQCARPAKEGGMCWQHFEVAKRRALKVYR